MSDIINFETTSKRRSKVEVKKTADVLSCDPPIEVKQVAYNSAIIKFRKDCFDLEIVKLALGRIKYGQDFWRLLKLDEENSYYDPLSMSFLVIIDRLPKNEKTNSVFCQIFSLMTEEAYIRELSVWPSKVSVDELTKNYQLEYEVGAIIGSRVAKLLRANGIKNAYDLIRSSREELCKINGMKTKDVLKLEKSLAVRGLSGW